MTKIGSKNSNMTDFYDFVAAILRQKLKYFQLGFVAEICRLLSLFRAANVALYDNSFTVNSHFNFLSDIELGKSLHIAFGKIRP